jgi:hypothetical protein
MIQQVRRARKIIETGLKHVLVERAEKALEALWKLLKG